MAIIIEFCLYVALISGVALLMFKINLKKTQGEKIRSVRITDSDPIVSANCGQYPKRKTDNEIESTGDNILKTDNEMPIEVVTWDYFQKFEDQRKQESKNIQKSVIENSKFKDVFVPEEININNANCYQIVRAVGDSMKENGILNHDVVWIKKLALEDSCESGDLVLIARKKGGVEEFKIRRLQHKVDDENWETCCDNNGEPKSHERKYFLGKVVIQKLAASNI